MKSLFILLLSATLLSACVSSPFDFKSPAVAPNVKNADELLALETQLAKDPKNLVLRAHLARQKELLVRKFLDEAVLALQGNNFSEADRLLDQALKINPASPGAIEGKREVEMSKRHLAMLHDAQELNSKGDTDQAEAKLKAILLEQPQYTEAKGLMRQINKQKDKGVIPATLKANISKPITLEFRETSLKTIFEMIARSSNVNFIFDKEVKGDTKATVFVRNTKIEEAIKVILVTNQLARAKSAQ